MSIKQLLSFKLRPVLFIIIALLPVLVFLYYRYPLQELFTDNEDKSVLYWIKNKELEKDRVILGKNIDSKLVSPTDALYVDEAFFSEKNIDSGLELYIGNSLHPKTKVNGDLIEKTRKEVLPYYKNEQTLAKMDEKNAGKPITLDILSNKNTALCFAKYDEINVKNSDESCLTANELKALKGEMKFKLQNKQWGSSSKYMKLVPEPLNAFETSGMKCGYAKNDLSTKDRTLFVPDSKNRY